MAQTIPALFDTYAEAEAAVRRLEAAGIAGDDISVVANNARGEHGGGAHAAARDGDAVGRDAGAGAGIGAAVGGAGGLLAGLGALAIPGLGPVVALGWLVSTAVGAVAGGVVGAAAGGLVGALTSAGVPKDEADAYAEGVRRGGTLVTVRTADDMAPRVQEILSTPTRVDIGARRRDYLSQGWTRFDDTAPAYTADEIAAERMRYPRA